MSDEHVYPDQVVPLAFSVVTALFGVALLFGEIYLLNRFVLARETIVAHLRWTDILVGLTIYLKTSIDFAIFIGRLMSKFPGWKNRIMIEIGSSLGNILGTLAILLIWDVFREVKFLMAIMIIIAAFVLLRLAEEGFEHMKDESGRFKINFWGFEAATEKALHIINLAVAPVLSKLIPETRVDESKVKNFRGLFLLAFSVPFILGLDDFAGYIPLFNVVNVFGFATGVFFGHMLLLLALFINPRFTIKAVKHPVISFFGSLAFIALALWGFYEAAHLIGL